MKPRSRPKTTDELLSANAERTEALRSQLRRLGVLYHVTRVVTQTHEPNEALQATLDEVMTATGATSGSIALVDPVSGDLRVHVHRGFAGRKIERCILHPGEGITGWVAQKGRSALVPDVRSERRYVQIDARIRAELAVPIRDGDTVLGVINVDHTRVAAFDQRDLEMLEAVATQAAGVLRVARLIRALESRTRALEQMTALGRSLVETLEPQEVFQRIAAAARELLDARLASLYLLDESGLELKKVSSDGPRWRADEKPLPVVGTRLGEAVRSSRPVRVRNVAEDAVFRARAGPPGGAGVAARSAGAGSRSAARRARRLHRARTRLRRRRRERPRGARHPGGDRDPRRAHARGRLRAQEERNRQERLVLLGVLAAEVAHEVRNPLSVMTLLVHSLRESLPDGDARLEDVRVLREKIAHLDQLTGRILGIARSRPAEFGIHSLGDLAKDVVEFVRPRLERSNIRIAVEVEDDLPFARVVRTELEQALLNLLLNAQQAMPGGGRLTVRVHQRVAKGEEPMLAISVADSGVGIDPATRVRILEPFFTTRDGGTGLGLSVVHRIVAEHGGTLRIRSKLGKGSTFVIEVPAHGG
ncbi:MAG: GAF domain-containing protein [Deltaproteobacteria bacterium]|nr:GAF domain-containing protein [Deltaproteobacteria bacterium]